uniref:Peptidyl-prolyl cis-trans isomerase n=2 Tax=Tetradesmus obliquus TaxID=3088 RepID=A0A383V6H5_TETOB|eukprot:jgi/Sobl393_1/10634/SZX74670.1
MLPAAARLSRPSWSCMQQAWTQAHRSSSHVVAAASSQQQQQGNLVRKLRLAHIQLPLDKQQQLDELEQQIKGGASFSELARQHSVCPSKRAGGELGWVSPGQLPPGFEPVVAAAAAGQVSRATTGRGHHLVMVLEEKQEAEVQHMSVNELQELLANPLLCEEVQFVDVREQHEFSIARLPHFKLLPLSTSSEWAPTIQQTLDPAAETVVLCHHGVRSMNAAMFLVSQGFTNVKNVTGGIAAYSMVDRSVPEY